MIKLFYLLFLVLMGCSSFSQPKKNVPTIDAPSDFYNLV